MYCTKCGNKFNSIAKYCNRCGDTTIRKKPTNKILIAITAIMSCVCIAVGLLLVNAVVSNLTEHYVFADIRQAHREENPDRFRQRSEEEVEDEEIDVAGTNEDVEVINPVDFSYVRLSNTTNLNEMRMELREVFSIHDRRINQNVDSFYNPYMELLRRQTGAEYVFISGMDRDYIRSMIQRIEDRLSWFTILDSAVSGIIVGEENPDAYASFSVVIIGYHNTFINTSSRIIFNSNKFDDFERLSLIYDRCLRANFHPQGTIPEDIMIHELMHALDFYLILRHHNVSGHVIDDFALFARIANDFNNFLVSEAVTTQAIENINNRRIANGLAPRAAFDLKNEVGGYAAMIENGRTNYAETFATALTDYFANGDNARELSLEMARNCCRNVIREVKIMKKIVIPICIVLIVGSIFGYYSIMNNNFEPISIDYSTINRNFLASRIASKTSDEFMILTPGDYINTDMESQRAAIDVARNMTNEIVNLENYDFMDTLKYFVSLEEPEGSEREIIYFLRDGFEFGGLDFLSEVTGIERETIDFMIEGVDLWGHLLLWYNEHEPDLWVQWLLWRNNQMEVDEIKDIRITSHTDGRYMVTVYLQHIFIRYTDRGMTEFNKYIDAILHYEIVFEESSNSYRVEGMTTQWVSDINEHFQSVNVAERQATRNNTLAFNKFTPSNVEGQNYGLIEELDVSILEDIHEKNKNRTVIISGVTNESYEIGHGYGFFIREGVVLTSYTTLNNILEPATTRFLAITADGEVYTISGVITFSSALNIAILRLEEEVGEPVVFGNIQELDSEEPIVTIGSSLGMTSTLKVGLFIGLEGNNEEIIRMSLPLSIGDSGSPVLNLDGEVIGINVSHNNHVASDLTFALDINTINDITGRLNSMNFGDIEYASFASIRSEIMQGNINVTNTINERVYRDFIEISNIETAVGLELVSGHARGGVLSLRYRNTTNGLLSNEELMRIYSEILYRDDFQSRRVEDTTIFTREDITIRVKERFGLILIIVEGVV
ncbi:MAG: serine protease [Oscillospiraceae bacterium]|nr:serine protease [Oscillospiraceae bacterium]